MITAAADYNRFPTRPAAAGRFKQWVHVAVIDPAIRLVANFSAMAAAGGTEHRLLVLVEDEDDGDGVRGHARRFAPARCAMPAGRTTLRFDRNELTAAGDGHALSLDEPELALRARLTLYARAAPAVLHHLPLGAQRALHWSVVPRLSATGAIEHAGRVHAVVDAPAYRDRNWGSFCFGDVAWDWGYAAAPAGGPPGAIAFARLLDAARSRVIEQHVLVWWGDRLLASFRDREVALAGDGAVTGALPTVPPALALCRPGRATGLPEVVTVTGASSRGRIALRFTRRATARVLVPNDARPGTTVLYESFGEVAATGRVDGEDIALAGTGLFECVHAGAASPRAADLRAGAAGRTPASRSAAGGDRAFTPSGSFRALLRASLAAVQRDAPASARATATALGAAAVELTVDGERLVIRAGPELAVEPAAPAPCAAEPAVEVATTAAALVALLDGRDELAPAILANRVRVRAAAADAARLFDAMRWFVEGCARSADAAELLAALRRRAGSNHDRRRT